MEQEGPGESAERSTPASGSRRVWFGFLAMSANYLWLMALQLLYAIATSRLLSPADFGNYAVALAGVAIMGVVGGSTLELAAARREHDSPTLDRALISMAMAIGCAALGLSVLLSGPWAYLWGIPASRGITLALALGLPFLALQGVFAGILRRRGQTSSVAKWTATAQSVAMAFGLAAVGWTGSGWALAISPVLGSLFTTIALSALVPRDRRLPGRPSVTSLADLTFSMKAAGMNLLRASLRASVPWSIGRACGSATLGSFNRATTLVTVPLESLQRAFVYAVYPELRPSGPVARSATAFTELMIIVTGPAIVLAGIGVFAAPELLALLLGPVWEEAVGLAGIATLIGVIPMVSAPLGTALEAQARFRSTLAAGGVSAVAIVTGALLTLRWGSPEPAMAGLVAGGLFSIPVLAAPLASSGQLDIRRWWNGVSRIAATQSVFSGLLFISLELLPDQQPQRTGLILLTILLEGSLLWMTRRRFQLVTILQERLGFRL